MSTPQLQTAALEEYDREGFVIFRDVLDADLIATASDHVEWLQRQHPELKGEELGHQLVADDPFWVRLVSDERLLDVAEAFIGPDIALFASHYISKPPFAGQALLWHQDAAYWPLEPMEVVTLWLAVDHSTPENGCMRVIPGTHRGEVHDLRPRTDVENLLNSEADADIDEADAVDLVLAPGDVEVHHPGLLHASHANTSPRRRCGLTIRYIPTSTRITSQPWPCEMLLRGKPGDASYVPHPVLDPSRHFTWTEARVAP